MKTITETEKIKNGNVKYTISTNFAKFHGYQSKKGERGEIKLFVAEIWKDCSNFEDFVIAISHILTIERYCLERAFNKIRIKGGMCNPCCIMPLADATVKYLFNIEFE